MQELKKNVPIKLFQDPYEIYIPNVLEGRAVACEAVRDATPAPRAAVRHFELRNHPPGVGDHRPIAVRQGPPPRLPVLQHGASVGSLLLGPD
jgi:hypothetical protein